MSDDAMKKLLPALQSLLATTSGDPLADLQGAFPMTMPKMLTDFLSVQAAIASDDPVKKLLADLETANETYRSNKQGGAILALTAFAQFLHITAHHHLLAPVLEATEIVRGKGEVDDSLRSKVAQIVGANHPQMPKLPQMAKLSKKHREMVLGCVAVECQMLNGCKEEGAMMRVVGNDAAAAKSLANFRHNIEYNDSPKGAWKSFEQWLGMMKEMCPVSAVRAAASILTYQQATGRKIVNPLGFTKSVPQGDKL